jgi:hypothetical protein
LTTKKLKLKVWDNNHVLVCINQGEVASRFLEVSFEDKSNDQPNAVLSLEGKTVLLYARKPDGNIIYNSCLVETTGVHTAVIELTSQMSAAQGELNCEFHIFDNDNSLLKVKGLQVIVAAAYGTAPLESSSEYLALINAINQVQSLPYERIAEILSEKLEEMSGSGGGLNADMVDSKHDYDFATALQGEKADSAIQSISVEGTEIVPQENNVNITSNNFANVPVVEVGTFTPMITTIDNTSPTYTTAYSYAKYCRIGNLVYVTFHCSYSISNAGGGNAYVSGLPYAACTGTGDQALSRRESNGAIGDGGHTSVGIVLDGTSIIKLCNQTMTAPEYWQTGNVIIGFSGCYITSL